MTSLYICFFFFFFFNDTATTEIYTLSLHDALPICPPADVRCCRDRSSASWRSTASRSSYAEPGNRSVPIDRKSTRLNSSHQIISYAVFCLKKKKNNQEPRDI